MKPRRTNRLALTVVAAVAVAAIGCELVAALTPEPSQAGGEDLQAGDLQPETRYSASRASDTGRVEFSFAVDGSGWSYDGFELIGHPDSSEDSRLWFYLTSSMYSDAMPITPAVFDDPCVHQAFRTFDASLAGQAEALVSIPGTESINGPADVTIDSRSGQYAEIAFPADLGCANSDFWLLFNASCGAPTIDCSNYPYWSGESLREWLIDVDGEIFNIRAQIRYPDESSGDLEGEIQRIVDSIEFE